MLDEAEQSGRGTVLQESWVLGASSWALCTVSHPLPQLRFCLLSTEHRARTQPTVLHPASAPRVLPQPVEEQRLLAALWGCSTPRGSAAPYHTWK